jgi:hypothetical protein
MATQCLHNHADSEVVNLRLVADYEPLHFKVFAFECMRCGATVEVVAWDSDASEYAMLPPAACVALPSVAESPSATRDPLACEDQQSVAFGR